ncbi:hypothetical protein FACS1894137_03110 [Spirochaetia bacterium]|nr:hypothetical protein FACS1894137_03110 [Spirochaetia bacterium]
MTDRMQETYGLMGVQDLACARACTETNQTKGLRPPGAGLREQVQTKGLTPSAHGWD